MGANELTKSEQERFWSKVGKHQDPGDRVTHCVNGHEYTIDNTYRAPDGHRHCRRCMAASRARYKVRKRGRANA